MKKITSIVIIAIAFFLLGCSMMNPGYSSAKPNISTLEPHKSTLKDVQNILGEPAMSQMQFNQKVVYKYFYKTSDATVDQTAMIKGDYRSGCNKCGEIIVIFRWKQGSELNDFLI